MTKRFRLALLIGAVALSGCSDSFNAGPVSYVPSEKMTTVLDGKPRLQAEVTKALNDLYGAEPDQIKVPAGSPLLLNGVYLASHYVVSGEKKVETPKYKDSATGEEHLVAGGYRPLSPPLPALSRRLGGRQRPDRAVPLAPPARLSTGGSSSSPPPRPPSRPARTSDAP